MRDPIKWNQLIDKDAAPNQRVGALERIPPKLPPRSFRRAPHEQEKKCVGQ
jgi:hypothetical protein